MKKAFNYTLFIVTCFIFIIINVNADDPNCPTFDDQSVVLSGKNSGVGQGVIIYFDKYEINNDVLNVEGYVYLKGQYYGDAIVPNVAGKRNNGLPYCYRYNETSTGGTLGIYNEFTFNPNTTYYFELENQKIYDDNNPSKFITIDYIEKNDDFSKAPVGFQYIERKDIFNHVCDMEGKSCKIGLANPHTSLTNRDFKKLYSQHYMGGFKLKVDFKRLKEERKITTGVYSVNVAINIGFKGQNYTWKSINKGYYHRGKYWLNLAAPITDKQKITTSAVNVQVPTWPDGKTAVWKDWTPRDDVKGDRVQSIVVNAHPYEYNGPGSTTGDRYSDMKIADSTSGYVYTVVGSIKTFNFAAKGFKAPGYILSVKKSGSRFLPCSGSGCKKIVVPNTWVKSENDLGYNINADDIPDPVHKTYSPATGSCPKGYTNIEEDTVLFSTQYTKNHDNEDAVFCNGTTTFGTAGHQMLYKAYCGDNADNRSELPENIRAMFEGTDGICEKIKNLNITDEKIVIGDIDTISDITDAKTWYEITQKLANGPNSFDSSFKPVYLDDTSGDGPIIKSFRTNVSRSDLNMRLGNTDDGLWKSPDEILQRLVGLDPTNGGFNVKLNNSNLDTGFVNYTIERKFQNDVKITAEGEDDINLCKDSNGTQIVNSDIYKNRSTLIQLATAKIHYCAKISDDNPEEYPYNPDPVICKKDDVTKGKYHETVEAHKNYEDFDNLPDTIGFVKLSNDYCKITCLDDVDIQFPGTKGTYAGATFDLNIFENERPNIMMTRSCYAKMNNEKLRDYNENADTYSEVESNKIKACFNFSPELYNSGNPDIKFNYQESGYAELNGSMYSRPVENSGKTIISTTNTENISSRDADPDNNYALYKHIDNIDTSLGDVCDNRNGFGNCTYNGVEINNIYYIKKTQTKKWEYNTIPYYVSSPDGNVSVSDSGLNTSEIDNNTVPVSLATSEGTYKYHLNIVSFEDSTRHNNYLIDKYKAKGMYIFNGEIYDDYTCNYTVTYDITKDPPGSGDDPTPKKTNFFYRTIDVSNMFPNSGKNIGYNWSETSNIYAPTLRDLIRSTSDYQVLTNNVDDDSTHKKSGHANQVLLSDHFSFRLTPSTMKKIRSYNNQVAYNSSQGLTKEDIDDSYYLKSSLLECLGKNDNDTCASLNLSDLGTTTNDVSLLEKSRKIIKLKNKTYPVVDIQTETDSEY